jgi:PEP-CTERM motif
MTIGREGSGVVSMSASHIDVGATGTVTIARGGGSTGSVTMTNGSTLTAQYLGVGRERLLDGTTKDGGVASLVINSGSTVTAGTLEIGTAGYLGGVGTIVGNVINHGVFNPGNSPGTMVINGSYTAGLDGKLILEVGLDSSGNFITDQVIFTQGTLLDLAHLDVEFKFLGAADPVAFNNSGAFDIDSFLKQQVADGNGGFRLQGLDDQQLAGATYAAVADNYQINNFSFSAAGGANNFTATPVPEPGTWLMLLSGLLAVGGAARRQPGRP